MVSISQVINQNHAPNRCHMFSKTEIQGVLKKKKKCEVLPIVSTKYQKLLKTML